MHQLNDFFNDGFGWQCRYCSRELARDPDEGSGRSRLFFEGEAEGKSPRLSNPALAKWADPAQRFLICPNCGIRELVDPS